MNWFISNLANIVIIILILALIYACIRSLVNQRKSGLPSCACGKNCSSCSLACAHGTDPKKN